MKPAPPAVTWLMTVKNGMPYLRDTLASIARQTFTDFEVLVWLIESNDESEEELQRWIPGRLPGRIIKSGPLGLGPARAALVSQAQTEFCACIDADDLNEPDRLERQIAFLRANPDLALVGSRLRVIDQRGEPTGVCCDFVLTPDDILHRLICENCIGHSSVVYRRAAIIAAGNYDKQDRMPEDYDLWLRLAMRHRMANLPEYLVRYRVHPHSHTRQVQEARLEEAVVRVFVAHAPLLYGLESPTALALRSRRAGFALAPALKIAWHLAKTHGGTARQRLRTPSFLKSLQSLRRYSDFGSRLVFDALDPRPGRLRSTLLELRGKALNRLRPSWWAGRRRPTELHPAE